MISIYKLLFLGVSVWVLSGIFALFSCWDGESTASFPGSGGGSNIVRTLGEFSSLSSASHPKDALLVTANGLKALEEAGVLTKGDSDVTSDTLFLVNAILEAAAKPLRQSPLESEELEADVSPSPSTPPNMKSHFRKIAKFVKKGEAGAQEPGKKSGGETARIFAPPPDPHYTHQRCHISADESEVSHGSINASITSIISLFSLIDHT